MDNHLPQVVAASAILLSTTSHTAEAPPITQPAQPTCCSVRDPTKTPNPLLQSHLPCALHLKRLRIGPWSAKASATYSLDFWAPLLFLALAAACVRQAESNTTYPAVSDAYRVAAPWISFSSGTFTSFARFNLCTSTSYTTYHSGTDIHCCIQ